MNKYVCVCVLWPKWETVSYNNNQRNGWAFDCCFLRRCCYCCRLVLCCICWLPFFSVGITLIVWWKESDYRIFQFLSSTFHRALCTYFLWIENSVKTKSITCFINSEFNFIGLQREAVRFRLKKEISEILMLLEMVTFFCYRIRITAIDTYGLNLIERNGKFI